MRFKAGRYLACLFLQARKPLRRSFTLSSVFPRPFRQENAAPLFFIFFKYAQAVTAVRILKNFNIAPQVCISFSSNHADYFYKKRYPPRSNPPKKAGILLRRRNIPSPPVHPKKRSPRARRGFFHTTGLAFILPVTLTACNAPASTFVTCQP